MRILLTNDDGINAAGMAAMECVAAELSDDVWTVAPETDQSGIAHALTFSHPLRVRELGQRRFAVNGTPADCVIVGATRVLPERPDIVLSGINLGQNIADDVFYSGTIGGAMEACFMGIRGIALSQAYRMVDGERYAPWETSQAHLPDIVRRLLDAEWADGVFFNVNVPAVAARSDAGRWNVPDPPRPFAEGSMERCSPSRRHGQRASRAGAGNAFGLAEPLRGMSSRVSMDVFLDDPRILADTELQAEDRDGHRRQYDAQQHRLAPVFLLPRHGAYTSPVRASRSPPVAFDWRLSRILRTAWPREPNYGEIVPRWEA